MSPYTNLIFEIVQHCNAKCYYCPTGIANINNEQVKKFIAPELFDKALSYMLENGTISSDCVVDIFNKGEPFLHPNFKEIISILNKHNLRYSLSTNASIKVEFNEKGVLRGLERIIISMPGFSADDYKRVHGFDFDKIKSNIVSLIKNFRENGFTGKALISFHLYKHNHNQLNDIEEFATKNGIVVNEYVSYIVDYNMLMSYLDNRLPDEVMTKISNELFFHDEAQPLVSILDKSPKKFWCEHENILTLDTDACLLPCSHLFYPEYKQGSIFQLKLDEIRTIKKSLAFCKRCRKYRIDYFYTVMNKFRASDVNRLYKEKIIKCIPNEKTLSHRMERTVVRIYLAIISNFGYSAYYLSKFLNIKMIYRKLIQNR